MIKRANDQGATDRSFQTEREFARLLEAVQTRGFYGTATITLNLQDGHIQHVKVATERMVK